MQITRKEYSFPSKSGLADIFARAWIPDSGVKAVFQIVHGMAEHGERYEEFAAHLCAEGFAVYCSDHLGHGKSVKSDADLGYFGEKDGWNNFIEDARTLTELAAKENPDLPIIFFGHSMGSFVAREYASRYGNDTRIKGFVFCGTSGANPAAPAGKLLANTVASIKGSRHQSKLINGVAFGPYNAKIKPARTAFDWLTREDFIVDRYVADKYCGFLFTATGYRDLFTLLARVSEKQWYQSLNKSMPVLVISGAMDPVGAYSKGVQQVYNDLKGANVSDATLKLYDGCRHEILNELNRNDVYADIAAWALSKIK